MELNGRKIINVEVDGIDHRDYPDYCDAHFSHAEYEDGTALTDDELELLTEQYPDYIYEYAYESAVDLADWYNDYINDR